MTRYWIRVAASIKFSGIAQDFCSDSRRGKGRIALLCNPCHNAEAEQKDKQDGIFLLAATLEPGG